MSTSSRHFGARSLASAAAAAALAGCAWLTLGISAHAASGVAIEAACTSGSIYCYAPASLTMAAGSPVTWTNQTPAPHTVTRCDASCPAGTGDTGAAGGPSSSQLGQGGQYSFTFTRPGTYVYYCMVHGYSVMHASVTVTGSAPTAPPATPPPPAPTSPPGHPAQTGSTPAPAPPSATPVATAPVPAQRSTESTAAPLALLPSPTPAGAAAADATLPSPAAAADSHTGLVAGLLVALVTVLGGGALALRRMR